MPLKKIGRKIYHLAGGIVLIGAYAALGRTIGLRVLLGFFIFTTALDVARLRIPALNSFMYRHLSRFIRDSEKEKLTGTPWYVLGTLCSAAFYGIPVAVYAVVFLACGDVAATTVGERWGTVKVSGEKSLQGTVAFFAASSVSGLIVACLFYPVSPVVYLTGAAVAAAVEILPIRMNDNLSIPVISGAAMQLLLSVVV